MLTESTGVHDLLLGLACALELSKDRLIALSPEASISVISTLP
jgi:hypothetical protein